MAEEFNFFDFFFREMKIEKEIFSAATDSRFLREVTNHLTLDTEFANNLSLERSCS